MKKMLIPLLTSIVLCGFVSIASASSIWIGTYSHNDKDIESYVSSWYSTYYGTDWGTEWEIDLYAKVDGSSGTKDGLTVFEGENGDKQNGTWETSDAINLFSVKASNGYALYWLDEAAFSGDWSTVDIKNGGGNQPNLSHFSAWTVTGYTPPASPVPEPGTLVLFGIGLLATVGAVRGRYSS